MSKVRCPRCRGKKVEMKLGAVLGKCRHCKGSGEVEEVDAKELSYESVIDEMHDQEPAQIKVKYRKKRSASDE